MTIETSQIEGMTSQQIADAINSTALEPAAAQPTAPESGQAAAAQETSGQTQQADTQTGTTFTELQGKTGIQSPDQLAASYVQLQRKLGEQGRELGQLRAQVQVPAQQDTPVAPQPVASQPAQNAEQFLAQLAVDPEGAIARIVEQRMRPMETERQLEQTVLQLSSDPTTAPMISNPAVQAKITELVTANPTLYRDNFAAHLPALTYMAAGMVGTQARPATPGFNPPAPVEGASKPVPVRTFDPSKATSAEIAAEIARLSGK